jgi:putative SOS response-associated peptidase YedK
MIRPTSSFCIITVESNDLVRKIHDRMPAIIHLKDHRRRYEEEDPRDLLTPYPSEEMTVLPA